MEKQTKKTKKSQLRAVKKYQKSLKTNSEKRRKRQGQNYKSNGKTWAREFATRDELADYIRELLVIGTQRFSKHDEPINDDTKSI